MSTEVIDKSKFDWIDATGHSKGDWVFQGEFNHTITYLSEHKKILEFNPFCHSVELLPGKDNVYKWLFRVADPRDNPFEVIFFVEQIEELVLELPKELAGTDPKTLSAEKINQYTVGKKIRWNHFPTGEDIDNPDRYLFEGKVFADMLMEPVAHNHTRVKLDLRVDVNFVLYPVFRIIPEPILRTMINAGMSFLMQTATNRMFNAITQDFNSITPPCRCN